MILLDAAPAVLPPFGEKLGQRAAARLEKMGVEIQLSDGHRRRPNRHHGQGPRWHHPAHRIGLQSVVGRSPASRLGRDLAEQSAAELDRSGRLKVLPDLSIPGHPNVFVVGDMAAVEGVPGVAQGAIQGAKYVANTIKGELAGADPAEREPFQYFDKGSMATVSRFSAVAKIGPLEFSGFIAWLAWLVLHLVYLVGFKTKVSTLLSWTVTFVSTHRGQLTITEQQAFARTRLEQLAELAAEARDPAATAGLPANLVSSLEVLQPHLAPGHHPVVVVGDRYQPQLLAPAAVDRFAVPYTIPEPMAPQEIGVVVDADDVAAVAFAGIKPGEGRHAGHALDHRAVDTAVHQAHRLQQLGLDLQLRAGAVGV